MPIEGKYELTKSENFEEYMKALGVGMVMRKMAAASTPVTEITKTGDDWNIKTVTTFKTTEIKFQLDKEFPETTADGRECQSKISMDGANTLVHTQTCKGQTFKILREFTDNEMKMTLEAPDVTCIRTYKKLEA